MPIQKNSIKVKKSKKKLSKKEKEDARTPAQIAFDDECEHQCTKLTSDKRWAASPFKKGFRAGADYQKTLK